MIKVNLEQTGKHFSMRVQGHAGAAKVGEDVVCAAASILVLALQQALSKSGAEDLEYSIAKGDFYIKAKCTQRALHNLESIICGFDFLANAYPQYVNMCVAS